MIASIIFLDHNATTPMHPEVLAAMQPYLCGLAGNASSMHRSGRAAFKAIEQAREQVAALIGARPEEIVFVSGGTEADNLALRGAARSGRIAVSAIEHPAVLRTAETLGAEGWPVDILPVDAGGCLDARAAAARLDRSTALVSVMAANNETGVVQPVAELAALLPENRPCLHCDAVQAVGKIPVDVTQLGVDLLSLSAHKMHGPQGVGALYVRKGTAVEPLLRGGSQERGLRPGTYNVAAIVGFGRAAELAWQSLAETAGYVAALRDDLEAGLLRGCPDAVIIGRESPRLPNTTNIAFPGHDNRGLAAELDMRGIAVATGSACSSGALEPSHVHAAMGLPPRISNSALRFSLGPDTTEEEIAQTLCVLKSLLKSGAARKREPRADESVAACQCADGQCAPR